MLRSKAASVRFAEVTKTASSSATTALAWRTPAGAVQLERARVVEHARPRGSRPIGRPEAIRKPPHELLRSGRVASLALDVQQQRDAELRPAHPCAARALRTPSVRRRRHRCSPRPSAPPSRATPRTRAGCLGRAGPAPRGLTTRGPAAACVTSPPRRCGSRLRAAGPEIPSRSSSSKRRYDRPHRLH